MEQLLTWSAENRSEKVYVVYVRTKKDCLKEGMIKIGKGYVKGGKHTRADKSSNDPFPMIDLELIPVIDEYHAFQLEKLLQNTYTSRGAHVEEGGGTEWFHSHPDPKLILLDFHTTLRDLTDNSDAGKYNVKLRSYQDRAVKKSNKFWANGGDEFYLLYKPRAGKNVTALATLVEMYKSYNDGLRVAHFLSLWPSAFTGLMADAAQFTEFADINCVDTSIPNWESQIDDDKINVLMSSMQSLGIDIEDENHKLTRDEKSKVKLLANYPAQLRIVDEADHGMRTPHAQNILDQLDCEHQLWMSGSDIYALANLATDENSCVFSIIEEREMIDNGELEGRPIIEVYATEFPDDVYEAVSDELVDEGVVSRRMAVIMETNVKNDEANFKIKDDGFYYVGKKRVEFNNAGVVRRMFETMYGINQVDGMITPRSLGLRHGYFTLPSVRALYAFANMIREHYDHEQLRVGVANEFGAPSEVEANVNAWIEQTEYELNSVWYRYETIFLAVAKLVRGATVKRWTHVVRMDDSVDWKIGHQRDLRCQSGDHEVGYVFDWNPLRRLQCTFDMAIATARQTNIDRETAVYQLINAQPLFLQHPNSWEQKEVNYADLVEAVKKSITQAGFGSEKIVTLDDAAMLDPEVVNRAMELSEARMKCAAIKEPDHERGKGRGRRTNPIPTNMSDRERRQLEIDLVKRYASLGYTIPLLVVATEAKYTELRQLCDENLITEEIRINYSNATNGIEWDNLKFAYERGILNTDHLDAMIEVFAHEYRKSL